MKKINENLKNLLSKEVNKDILKISFTVIIYLVVIAIFQAGLEVRNISKIKTKKEEPKVERFKYFVTYNGDEDEYVFTEPKNLFFLIDGIEDIDIEFIEYYEGKELKSIDGKTNFKILVEDQEIKSNFFDRNSENLPDRTDITIIN